MRLIDADELCEQVWREALDTREKIEKLVLRQPTIDAVSVGALEQFKWERDVAIEQLNEIGKGLGSKMDDVATVVRCKDCKFCQHDKVFNTRWCNGHEVIDDWFCAGGKRKDDETY